MFKRAFLALSLLLWSLVACAALSTSQLAVLKAAILADPVLAAETPDSDGAQRIADAMNALAAPAFYVWRTNVSREEIYNSTSAEATTWNWTTYKNQGATEQNAWTQMFMGDRANFAQANLRAGVAAIFTGSGPANAQRDHILAVAKRPATRGEKLFAVGTGTLLAPATMAFEGVITYQDVQNARSL